MTPAARLSNALDTGSPVLPLALKLTLSNALDKAVSRRVLRLDRGVSNALDTREAPPIAPRRAGFTGPSPFWGTGHHAGGSHAPDMKKPPCGGFVISGIGAGFKRRRPRRANQG